MPRGGPILEWLYNAIGGLYVFRGVRRGLKMTSEASWPSAHQTTARPGAMTPCGAASRETLPDPTHGQRGEIGEHTWIGGERPARPVGGIPRAPDLESPAGEHRVEVGVYIGAARRDLWRQRRVIEQAREDPLPGLDVQVYLFALVARVHAVQRRAARRSSRALPSERGGCARSQSCRMMSDGSNPPISSSSSRSMISVDIKPPGLGSRERRAGRSCHRGLVRRTMAAANRRRTRRCNAAHESRGSHSALPAVAQVCPVARGRRRR